MILTRPQLIMALTTATFVFLAQMLAKTSVEVAAVFSIAIFFGIMAVYAGGGLRSAFGCLNAILIGKYLLVGIVLKSLVLQPADGPLLAPVTTALVMAIGFAGLFAGTA